MLSVVVLTMGNRPVELDRSIRSALDQKNVDVEVVLVANGIPGEWSPPIDDVRVKLLRLPSNLGIPGGRNAGVAASTGDLILFLDDDGYYPSLELGKHLVDAFAADASLGIVSFRVEDPEGGPGQRRHVPRLRAGDPLRSSTVTTFLGGACAMRRTTFDAAGGLPADFFYAHEETDLAWRAMDAGFRIVYDATAIMCHPAVLPTRHAMFYRYNARNRVWLAKRNLPWPLAMTYIGVWVGMTILRERSPRSLRPWFKGFVEGWRTPSGDRRPMKWRTAWRMTLIGRPPII
jgi:GT2 family glycosyltransferase